MTARICRVSLAAMALTTLLGVGPARAAEVEAIEDYLSRDWYVTEVVIFQRPRVLEHGSTERLARPAVPLPYAMRLFSDPTGPRWSEYPVEPSTRAYLAFPYLDQSRLPGDAPADPDPSETPDDDPASAVPATQAPPVGGTAAPGIEPQLAPDPLLQLLEQLAEFERGLEAASYQWQDPDSFVLSGAANRLTRRGGYQVLLHGRWLQPVPARDAPEPLLIRAGPRYGDSYALQGTLDVTLGRYLHFRTRLYYTEPLLGRLPFSAAIPPPAGQAGQAALAPSWPALSPADLTPAGYMQLDESRRLRSEELHYLDHPKLGVLVRIDPVPIPTALSDAFAALEESRE